MPMRNASAHLREAIDSVLSQTFTDFEFLIVDDGSTDQSVAIVESYSDPRIRLIRREHDYIGALNTLLTAARGQYIARMDADDVMLPTRLALQLAHMTSHPETDLLGGGVIMFGEESDSPEFSYEAVEVTLRDLVARNRVNHPTAFLRRETFLELGLLYDREYVYAEDYKLWSELAKRGGRIVTIDEPVLNYRVHCEQVSNLKAEQQNRIQHKIREENRLHAAREANKSYIEPEIAPTSNKITVIIPFLNEGMEVVNTVASVREFAGKGVDIIVINDYSYDGIDYGALLRPYNVYYFVNFESRGVAGSRDFGVSKIRTPYFLLLDAHMRFYEGECFATISRLLDANDRRLLCCQSTAILPDEESGEMLPVKDYPLAYGAYLTMKIGGKFLDVDWKSNERDVTSEVEEIPVILGAGYAASRRYWEYLAGLRGLKCYGSDECYLSLKTWLEGGSCLLLKKHILGHYYRTRSPYLTYNDLVTYNHFLIAETILPPKQRSYCYASYMFADHRVSTVALKILRREIRLMAQLREYYSKIFTRPYSFFAQLNHQEFDERRGRALALVKERLPELGKAFGEDGGFSLLCGQGFKVLSSAMVYMIFGQDYDGDFSSDYQQFIASVRTSEPLEPRFLDGAFGLGWLIMYLHHLGLSQSVPSDVINSIDGILARMLNADFSIREFDGGAGGMLCYALARLHAGEADSTAFSESEFNTDLLVTLFDLAKKVIATAGCDFRTYLSAFEFIALVADCENQTAWQPDVRDWLYEPENEKSNPKDTPAEIQECQNLLLLAAASLQHS